MNTHYDAAIIGAGPAGMAAATTLARHGARTLLLDEQPGPGGQIYRGIEAASPSLRRILGADYARGARLAADLRAGTAEYAPGSAVWHVAPGREIYFTRAGLSHCVTAETLILATGAMERPMPVPGWTLPGVFTAGGLQVLLKAAGIVNHGVVLAGSGPLLYLLAAQYVAAGAPTLVVLDTAHRADKRASLAHLPAALHPTALAYLGKGVRLFAALWRAKVPVYRGVSDIRITGPGKVNEIHFTYAGKTMRFPAHAVGLHAGVIPATHVPNALGCVLDWDVAQACLRPRLDGWGHTTRENVFVAGDGGGIGGARAAEHAGRLAALEALRLLGRIDQATRDRLAAPDRAARQAHLAIRPFLDRRYAPATEFLRPVDETIVCRCEEVTAGQVRTVARQGCQGPNQAKAFLRAGMGACQGRMCGPVVAALMADVHRTSPAAIGTARARPPFRPVTVGELASLD